MSMVQGGGHLWNKRMLDLKQVRMGCQMTQGLVLYVGRVYHVVASVSAWKRKVI